MEYYLEIAELKKTNKHRTPGCRLQEKTLGYDRFYLESDSTTKFFVQLVELIIHLKAIDYSGCAVSILIIPFGG